MSQQSYDLKADLTSERITAFIDRGMKADDVISDIAFGDPVKVLADISVKNGEVSIDNLSRASRVLLA